MPTASHLVVAALLLIAIGMPAIAGQPAGQWPTRRQNPHLTAIQPLPGRMTVAPRIFASYDLGAGRPLPFGLPERDGKQRFLTLWDGAVACWEHDGTLVWRSHPPGLNFISFARVEDLDRDGRVEILLQAGRPASPYSAVALLSADTGELLWRYDVEPMSYSWYVTVDHFLPGREDSQFTVLMHGYPPDEENGYIALFEFPAPSQPPRMVWRYAFDHYTCFPSLLRSDVDGDGVREIIIETHSRMWVMDPSTGAVKQFLQWDVSPANIRSYGLVKFVDLNGDGREDFLCIADFSIHHEVLLNVDGKLQKAWHHGWAEDVNTPKVASNWPEPPHGDLDGDGRTEIVLSMYNGDYDGQWKIHIYDAVTGELRAKPVGLIAVALADLDGDGRPEIAANECADPTATEKTGAKLLRLSPDGTVETLWSQTGAVFQEGAAADAGGRGRASMKLTVDGETGLLTRAADGSCWQAVAYTPPEAPSAVDPPKRPAIVGRSLDDLLVADIDSDGCSEIIYYSGGTVHVLGRDGTGGLVEKRAYESSGWPALADLDGDGNLELITGTLSTSATPIVEARTPAKGDAVLWRTVFPPAPEEGLPAGNRLYFQTGRFTGKPTPDVYVWATMPVARSVMLDGLDGHLIWERNTIPEVPTRHWAPKVNLASVYDLNGDGCEDLVFTNPDMYCVASGPTADLLVGPILPNDIFKQPSQGLYTLPAILKMPTGPDTVALVSGHNFVAAMTVNAEPYWYHLPKTGEDRCLDSVEGFIESAPGEWLMGIGRQNGKFACLNVADGTTRWEVDLQASTTGIASGDVDGDGMQEFLVGTSHGELWAIGDSGGQARVVWKATYGPESITPWAIADVDNDGASEIIARAADGRLLVLGK